MERMSGVMNIGGCSSRVWTSIAVPEASSDGEEIEVDAECDDVSSSERRVCEGVDVVAEEEEMDRPRGDTSFNLPARALATTWHFCKVTNTSFSSTIVLESRIVLIRDIKGGRDEMVEAEGGQLP